MGENERRYKVFVREAKRKNGIRVDDKRVFLQYDKLYLKFHFFSCRGLNTNRP